MYASNILKPSLDEDESYSIEEIVRDWDLDCVETKRWLDELLVVFSSSLSFDSFSLLKSSITLKYNDFKRKQEKWLLLSSCWDKRVCRPSSFSQSWREPMKTEIIKQ